MTTARRLQEIREQQQARRRATRLWDAALGGRSALPIPLGLGRTKGGVQQPSIGTVSDLGEVASWHMRGPLVVDESDDYPLVQGGSPRIVCQLKIAPSTAAEVTVYRNLVAIGSPIVLPAGVQQVVTDFEEAYEPLDTYTAGMTDAGAGAEGLIVVAHFRLTLNP